MAYKFEFDALIHKHGDIDAAYIDFPFDVKKEFGKGRVKVKALIDGFIYRGSLVKMGGDCHWLGITREVRKAIGKDHGDNVHVIIEEDTEERIIELPDDLKELLQKEPVLFQIFNKLAYTHKKEYVRWVEEAKKEETRKSRMHKMIEMLRSGKKL